jgi:lipopolysaccharide/colanic/teichoic acid biosynthesis glycosyltransferase
MELWKNKWKKFHFFAIFDNLLSLYCLVTSPPAMLVSSMKRNESPGMVWVVEIRAVFGKRQERMFLWRKMISNKNLLR